MVASVGASTFSVANVSVKSLGHSDAAVDLELLGCATTTALFVAGNFESTSVAGRHVLIQSLRHINFVNV